MSLSEDIKFKLARLHVLEKLIVVNLVVFVIVSILEPFVEGFFKWFELPSEFSVFLGKPWTIISYAFMHYDLVHMAFNMLMLYFIGRLFMTLFGPKLALNIYFLGAMVGGFVFMIGFNLWPEFFDTKGLLVGASAAVMALFIFLCAYFPKKEVRFFSFNMKLWHLGAAFIVFDIIGLFGDNAGGKLSHLGGALLGVVYAKQLARGNDIGRGVESIIDAVSSWFSSSKKSNLKTVYKDKSKVGGYTKGEFSQFNDQKKIDVILDKISKSGYESLSAAEKEFLFKAGKK